MTLLITDGGQTRITNPTEPNPVQVSNFMKARGITITAMGIGSADPVALWSYVSNPADVIFVPDFDQLAGRVIETSQLLCPSKFCL